MQKESHHERRGAARAENGAKYLTRIHYSSVKIFVTERTEHLVAAEPLCDLFGLNAKGAEPSLTLRVFRELRV